MADGLCSDGKTVASLINEKSIKCGKKVEKCEKSISANSVECNSNKIERSETQKSGIIRNHNMTANKQLQQNNVDMKLSNMVNVIGSVGHNNNNGRVVPLTSNIIGNDKKLLGTDGKISSSNSAVLKKNNNIIAATTTTTGAKNVGLPEVDITTKKRENNSSGQETDDSRTKKRCADRYASSESSDSGVATLSCTDSSTASSDASDPGSPYSPVSLGEDVHQSSKANMPPQTIQSTQIHQQQTTVQHQWPWNATNNTINNNNNNSNASNKNNSVNSVASSKHKRLSTSDINGTAKKVRTSISAERLESGGSATVKRLKPTPIEESQTKITGYFKSQMKPLNGLKYFNILAKAKDEKDRKTIAIKKDFEIDAQSLPQTMPPSLKKIERKTTAKVAQVAPISRKTAASQQIKSPKKHIAIAPRTSELRKTTANALRKQSTASYTIDQAKISQPTVLLTAIRIPPTNGQQQMQTAQQAQQQQSKANTTQTKVGSVFQIPVMPNLVQIPNILTTNGTNLVVNNNGQLARVGNGAQYFVNGTVFKLQQIATNNGHNGNGNTTNGMLTMESGLQGNILVKPPTIAQTVPLTTSTTAKGQQLSMQQQPIVSQSTINTNGCHHPALQGHNFSANQRITTQSVLMATSTGLLWNATLPAVIATSKLPALTPTMPSLQPIQQPTAQNTNILPSISTILQAHASTTTPPSLHHPTQTQYIVSQADSSVVSNISHSTLSSMVCKSARGQIATVTSLAGSIMSPVPPLVTLASKHETVSTGATFATNCRQSTNNITLEAKCKSLITPTSVAEKQFRQDSTQIIPTIVKQESNCDKGFQLKLQTCESALVPPVVSSIEVLKSCLPSPKSLVLEQIQQKTPPDVFINGNDLKIEPLPKIKLEELLTSAATTDVIKSPTIDTAIEEATLPKCAKSPILSQPKTIRFPVPSGDPGYRFGPKGTKRHDGVCYWDKCNAKYDTSSKLFDHLQTQHVNTQAGPFACLWSGCKVRGRESCSRRWLERHVLSHGGSKPFKCIVDGCGLRFGSQMALEKHVNGHFNTVESKDNTSKRTSDPPMPKLLRKNGKKLRYRRQPFSARMFDFFDSGVMEGLQHRLMVTGSLASGPKGSVTFQGRTIARRKLITGITEIFVRWSPNDIIPDEWIPETSVVDLTKTLTIQSMRCQERIALQKHLGDANLISDISSISQSQYTSSIAVKSLNSELKASGRKQSRKPPKRIQIQPS